MFLDFQQKRKLRNILYSKITISILIIFSVYVLYSTIKVYGKMRVSGANLSKTEKKVYELEAQKKNLDQKIERLKTEDGIEKEIRSKFAVAKSDENMVIIIPNQLSTSPSSQKDNTFWFRVKKFFGF